MAPNIGPKMATAIAEKLNIQPHWAVPYSTLLATLSVKYVAKTNVVMTVGNAELAQSYRHHENSPRVPVLDFDTTIAYLISVIVRICRLATAIIDRSFTSVDQSSDSNCSVGATDVAFADIQFSTPCRASILLPE